MKPKGLLVAVGLLAVLGGLVWWSNKKQADTASKPADTSTKILSIPEAEIQEIRIKKLTNETETLRRQDGKWSMTEPKPMAADQDAVSSMVSTLTSLNADKVIDEKAQDLKAYGLNDPTLDITVKRRDGKTDQVLIGDDTPTGSGAYAKLPNDPRVFTVATMTKTSLDKRPDDLRDKRVLPFDQDKLTRVELQAKGQTVEFGKNNQNEWQILKPRPLRADSSAVEGLISKLKDAKLDTTTLPADAAKAFAGAAKVATASVSDAGGTQTLEVRKDKDKNVYVKSSSIEGIYKVSANDLADGVDKGVDDFRNKKVLDFGFSDPSKVVVKGAEYDKTGDKWTSGSKTMDNGTVQALIDKLRDLSATKFSEKAGGGDSVFDASVTSNGGKRVEKVTVRKQGDQYFAQREGEPSIYELDGKAVEDLQKAAADVKEAAPEAGKKK